VPETTNQVTRIADFSAQCSLYTNHDYKNLYLKLVVGLSHEFHSYSGLEMPKFISFSVMLILECHL
jgi:hypothetical protein